jgi:hypothetical protein
MNCQYFIYNMIQVIVERRKKNLFKIYFTVIVIVEFLPNLNSFQKYVADRIISFKTA